MLWESGIVFFVGDSSGLSDYIANQVEFAELEYEAICAYVASGEPMDKAGAYGIQVGVTLQNCK